MISGPRVGAPNKEENDAWICWEIVVKIEDLNSGQLLALIL
jgi:hypothetical protein